MPFLAPDTDLELQKTTPTPNPQLPDQPALDVLAAAERSSNLAGTLYDTYDTLTTNLAPNPHTQPGFDPAVSIPKGYESQADLFYDVRSPEDMEIRRQQIDRENQDKQTIAQAGGWGLAASMAAGFTDPLTLASMAIPVGAPTRLLQAGKFAVTAGATTALQEAAMQELQVTRTARDSALNIGASTILGGVLGAVLRPHVAKAAFEDMSHTLHHELNDPAVPGETVLGPTDGRGRIVPETEMPGTPLYHGSPANFDEFSLDHLGERNTAFGKGIYLTDSLEDASTYARTAEDGAGNVYSASVPKALADKFANWSKPIGEQDFPPEVMDVMRDVARAEQARFPLSGDGDPDNWTFGHLYSALTEEFGGSENLKKWLQSQGIHGHTFSGYTEGKLSRNFVVYDPRSIKVTAKNGKPLTTPALGESVPVEKAAQAAESTPAPAIPDPPLTITEMPVNPSGESTAGAAAVSSPTMRGETIARGARTLVEGPIGRVSPGGRLMSSLSVVSRRLLQAMANLPETTEKNYAGIATTSPVERELWKYEGVHYQGMRARGAQFRAYKERIAGMGTGEQAISREDFMREIAYAMRRGDRSAIPEVAEAAKQTRAIEFDPLKERAIKAGLLPEGVTPEGADSYLMRQYDARKISGNLTDWMNRLKSGFIAQGVDPAEAADIAHKATRNVLGSERGTMDWKTMDGIVPESGQLKERTLKLPDTLLEPYLNNDIDHVAHSYLRSMAPEVEMTERFGSRDLKDQLAYVRDDYARMIERTPDDAGKQTLQKQMDADLRDLTAVRDRLYGIYGQPKDPGSFFVRAGRLLRSENALRLLGAATLSHFPDLANVMMRYGMPQTVAAMARVLTSKEAFTLTREESKRMGAALDMTMNVTASLLGDYGSHSQYAEQRVANKLTRAFTILTGETPLITATQALTSTLAQHELINTAQTIAKGGKVDSNLLARTAAAGIDQNMLGRIAQQYEQFGAEVNGLHFGMSDQWTDTEAMKAFESAILRDAHSVTLRPGAGDTPLLMSTEIGKTLLQFKSFGYAASRSVLNPMMQGIAHGDPRAAMALMTLVGMGTATYVAKQKAAGQPLEPFNSPRLALEIIDKANLMGWTSEFIFPLLWQAGIKNVSRFGDRDAVETIFGPSAGTIASTYERRLPQKILGNQTDKAETFNRSDLHFLRRLAPGQNLWYLRKAISDTEDAIGDAFDLPGKSNAERAAENATP
jgi:hypothetical protein